MLAYIILMKTRGNFYGVIDAQGMLAVMDRKDQCGALIQSTLDRVKPTAEDLAKYEFAIYEVTSVQQLMKEVVCAHREIRILHEDSIELTVLVLGQDCKKAFNRGTKFLPRKIEETPVDV